MRKLPLLSPQRLIALVLAVDCLVVLAGMLAGWQLYQDPSKLMGEHRPLTWFSFLQLLGTAGVTGRIFQYRRSRVPYTAAWRAPFFLWFLVAMGFVYFAIDEVAGLHEEFDRALHGILQARPTELTDRLDGVIVGVYGVIGLWVLYVYRQELFHYRDVVPHVTLGFGLFGVMVLLDLASDGDAFFSWLTGSVVSGYQLARWVSALEDGMKLVAEGVFFSAAYACREIAKQLHGS